MLKTYRVGVIGLGLMGRRMLHFMGPHRRFEVTRVFDLDASALESAAPLAPAAQVATDRNELVTADDVDLVYVATPPAAHVADGLAAFEAGKSLFCEKPLSVDIVDGRRLVEAAESSTQPSAVNFPMATLHGLNEFRSSIAQSGPAVRIEIDFHFSQWPRHWHHAGAWLAGPSEGGFLREVFSHFADLTHRLHGPLSLEWAHLAWDPIRGTEIEVEAKLRSGETPVSLRGAVGGAAPDRCAWTLYGETGSHRLSDWSELWIGSSKSWERFLPHPSPSEEIDSDPGQQHLNAVAAMLDGKSHPLPSISEAWEVQRVVEAVRGAGSSIEKD